MPRRLRRINIDDEFDARTLDELITKLTARAREEWAYEARRHEWLKNQPPVAASQYDLNNPETVRKWEQALYEEVARAVNPNS